MFNKKCCIFIIAVVILLSMIIVAGCSKAKDSEEYFVKGIDISEHQGNINEKKITASVVVVRLGYSGYGTGKTMVDSEFIKNINKLSTFEGEIAIYWASHSISVEEVNRENEFIVQTLNQVPSDVRKKIQYLFIDREQSGTSEGRADMLNKVQFNTVLCTQVKGLQEKLPDMKIGIYTNVDYLVNMIDYHQLGNVPCWIAWYIEYEPASFEDVINRVSKESTDICEYLKENIVIWQYSSAGTHPGIDEVVDLDLVSSKLLG